MIAYLVSGFINIYIMSKSKIWLAGRFFWMRNISTSIFSEIIYTILIIPMISLGTLPFNKILVIISSSFLFKLIYAFLIAWSSSRIVKLLKKLEGIDTYDYNVNYNPFIFQLESFEQGKNELNNTVIDMRKYKAN